MFFFLKFHKKSIFFKVKKGFIYGDSENIQNRGLNFIWKYRLISNKFFFAFFSPMFQLNPCQKYDPKSRFCRKNLLVWSPFFKKNEKKVQKTSKKTVFFRKKRISKAVSILSHKTPLKRGCFGVCGGKIVKNPHFWGFSGGTPCQKYIFLHFFSRAQTMGVFSCFYQKSPKNPKKP